MQVDLTLIKQQILTALGPPQPPRISSVSLSITIWGRHSERINLRGIMGRGERLKSVSYLRLASARVRRRAADGGFGPGPLLQIQKPHLVTPETQTHIMKHASVSSRRRSEHHTYICRAPREPPNTTMVLPITEDEWPAMGGGPWVVTMQFHLRERKGRGYCLGLPVWHDPVRNSKVFMTTTEINAGFINLYCTAEWSSQRNNYYNTIY